MRDVLASSRETPSPSDPAVKNQDEPVEEAAPPSPQDAKPEELDAKKPK